MPSPIKGPAYYYDFGNLRLTAAEVMSDHFVPRFHFGGVWRGANSISMVDFVMPLEVESLEQGAAWILYGIGKEFRPRHPTPWLADGWTWQDRLPWVRRMEVIQSAAHVLGREGLVQACGKETAPAGGLRFRE